MEDLFRDYWWLLFPLVGFGFTAWERYFAYRRHRDNIELLKAYAAQGKDPPAEVLNVTSAAEERDWGYRGRRCGPRGPMADWRRVVIFGVLAGSFWFADMRFGDETGAPFEIVAIVMSALAVAFAAFALLGSVWKDR
ncbi:MAG: hypothetical protein BGN86_10375 [Caulobacterales bacterium 68-7]|nr:hypothetical protein [Caulobacterales bacterium]OJU09637.1 MAG: hypothetical protein BGN86_10375 [Caulobacterales bacterium 68-7]